jgi:hypothetical protein
MQRGPKRLRIFKHPRDIRNQRARGTGYNQLELIETAPTTTEKGFFVAGGFVNQCYDVEGADE